MPSDATQPDMPRPDAPGRDAAVSFEEDLRHSLPLDRVGNLYAERGFPRSARSLQRFCASGHLDCQKVATATGDKYLVAPYSVERHLTQLAQLAATEAATRPQNAPRPDGTRQVATPVGPVSHSDDADDGEHQEGRQAETQDDMAAPVAALARDASQLVAQLEKRIGEKNDEIQFLRGEVATKNRQLADASERDRETNVLIQGLQSMVLELTGNRRLDAALPEARTPEVSESAAPPLEEPESHQFRSGEFDPDAAEPR